MPPTRARNAPRSPRCSPPGSATANGCARFDRDGDGQVDLREWEDARLAAQHEVRERRIAKAASSRPVHTLTRPDDGRLFLLANALPERIAARFRYWSWAHLAIGIAAAGAGLALL